MLNWAMHHQHDLKRAGKGWLILDGGVRSLLASCALLVTRTGSHFRPSLSSLQKHFFYSSSDEVFKK